MAQSLDHGLSFVLTGLWLWLALSFFDGLANPMFFVGLGASFWAGLVGLMFLNGVCVRLLGFYFFGASPGARFMTLRIYLHQPKASTLLGVYLWESLEGAFPGLWILSTLLRLSDSPIGVSYISKSL